MDWMIHEAAAGWAAAGVALAVLVLDDRHRARAAAVLLLVLAVLLLIWLSAVIAADTQVLAWAPVGLGGAAAFYINGAYDERPWSITGGSALALVFDGFLLGLGVLLLVLAALRLDSWLRVRRVCRELDTRMEGGG